ncbi:hypothetical protein IQ276_027155 [Desmonostoc muscorum LEGE 12446]|uniref:Uncharacterized protein n=1 Tax=Desmonostoc muscorum LEGE 12446 TaxID=1828758 RepID=A0A8J7DK43_DESMC|nr:hypothetical protein [Desmonostoc muscorum]MCF2150046.1 hypothetical protein [Desmonostoc muscorum LEGE 12446]
MISPVNSNFAKGCKLSAFACAIVTATIGVDFIGTKSIVQAQILPLTICPSGTEAVVYNPPLTNQVQNTTVTIGGSVGGCVNAQGITSGTYTLSFTAPTSCNNIGFFPTYEIQYNWVPTNQTSLVEYTTTESNVVDGQTILTSYGTVKNGVFQKRSVTRIITLATTDIDACSTQGLSFITGPQVLLIGPASPL